MTIGITNAGYQKIARRLISNAESLAVYVAIGDYPGGFTFDPAGVQHRQPVRTFVGHHMRLAAFAAVKREVFPQNLDGDDFPLGELRRLANGLPVLTNITSGKRARPGVHEVRAIDDGM